MEDAPDGAVDWHRRSHLETQRPEELLPMMFPPAQHPAQITLAVQGG